MAGRREYKFRILAVQRGSSTLLWVLMNDGTLGVLTTNVEQQVTAWQRVDFPGRQVAGLRGLVYVPGATMLTEVAAFEADGRVVLPAGSVVSALVKSRVEAGLPVFYGLPYESVLQTLPLERESSFNAVHQLGRVKLRLLDSDPSFEFRASHAARWELYDPARDALEYPFSGAIRVSHILAPGVGQGFCLRYSGTRDFCLLSLTVDMDFHGR